MIMLSLRNILIFFLTFIISEGAKNVTISKCCKFDEILTNEHKCVLTTDKSWTLKVFSGAKKAFLPKNTIPTNWHLKDGYKPNCKPKLFTAHMPNYIPFQNGSIFVVDYNQLVHPLNYCIDYSSVLLCLKEDNHPQAEFYVEVKKCCGKNAIFSETNQTCIFLKSTDYSIDVGDNKTLIGGFPQCTEQNFAILGKFHEAVMFNNGSLWMEHTKTLLPAANYCLEHTLENTGRSASIMACQEHLVDRVKNQPTSDLRFTLYPIGLALSAVFLAATLAAGSLLPQSHHVLHWKCQTNYVACLLVGNILLCIIQLSSPGIGPTPCVLIAVFMHFVFLAAFFWLNTMCFNIWWTFRDLRPQSMEKSQERCRLRLYEIYAWGGPLVISGTAAILNSIPNSPDNNFLKPGFGKNSCWFYGNMEIFLFFFGPMGLLLLINLTLFALTARELTCGLWKGEPDKANTQKAALRRVCVKLVVVMGVTWIADVISWVVGGPQELWYLTDLINCLQGVFIFIVVGCQPQVLSAVKRLWCLKKHQENGTAGTTNHHSSSSQGLPSMGDSVTNSVTNNTTKSIPLETTC